MSDQPLSQEQKDQIVKAVYGFAAQMMKKRKSDAEIVAALKEKGLDDEGAQAVVTNLRNAIHEESQRQGPKNMLYGGLWCAGGILVTVITYNMASMGGGRYIVAWGAIIFGAVQFFRGLFQKLSR